MKKNFIYALMGAIALTGAVGFTSCTDSDEDVAVNPTYDPVNETVTTQFVLNIAGGEMQETRQGASTVQKDNNFRGMQNSWLIGLATGKGSSYIAPLVKTNQDGLTIKQAYNLGELYGDGSVKNDADNSDGHKTNAGESSHRVV